MKYKKSTRILGGGAKILRRWPRGRVCRCDFDDGRNESGSRDNNPEVPRFFPRSQYSMPGVVCHRKPSPFLPPTRAIEAQMNALQSNDWPEEGSGIKAAFQFSWPSNAEEVLPGEVNLSLRKSWMSDSYVGEETFFDHLFHLPYSFLLHCENWEVCEDLCFTDREGLEAEQTVKVRSAKGKEALPQAEGHHYFKFRMKQISSGSFRGFWMTDEVSYEDYRD